MGRWLAILAEAYGQSVSTELTEIWIRTLAGFPVAALDRGFQHHLRTSKFFPRPAEVLEVFRGTEKAIESTAHEEAWQVALDFVCEWWHPDLGFSKRAPRLEEKMRRAVLAAGGFHHLFNCDRDELQWAKRRFVEAYAVNVEMERRGELYSDCEAAKLLQEVRDYAAQKPRELPPAPDELLLQPEAPARSKTIVVRRAEAKELTQQEWDRKQECLRAQKNSLLWKYGTKVYLPESVLAELKGRTSGDPGSLSDDPEATASEGGGRLT